MRGIAPILGVALLVIATVTSAEAPPRPSSDPIASAFEALSPGNRRIARAIFTAQARAFIEPGATPL